MSCEACMGNVAPGKSCYACGLKGPAGQGRTRWLHELEVGTTIYERGVAVEFLGPEPRSPKHWRVRVIHTGKTGSVPARLLALEPQEPFDPQGDGDADDWIRDWGIGDEPEEEVFIDRPTYVSTEKLRVFSAPGELAHLVHVTLTAAGAQVLAGDVIVHFNQGVMGARCLVSRHAMQKTVAAFTLEQNKVTFYGLEESALRARILEELLTPLDGVAATLEGLSDARLLSDDAREARAFEAAGDLLLEFQDMGGMPEEHEGDTWGLMRERLAEVLLHAMKEGTSLTHNINSAQGVAQ